MALDRSQNQLQGVFKLQRTGRTIFDDRRDREAAPVTTAYRARKSHRKSRLGCTQCRRRRVKCDEIRDQGCERCRNAGIECDYLLSHPTSARRVVQLQARKLSDACHQANHQSQPVQYDAQEAEHKQSHKQRKAYADRAALAIVPCPRSLSSDPISTMYADMTPGLVSPLASLHHFEAFTSHTCGSPMGQAITRSCVTKLAVQHPYLLHAVLGVAAAHMSYLIAPEVNEVQHTRNKMTDAWHWAQALALFRKQLGSGANRDTMDSLLSTVVLVAVHQFRLRPDDEQRGREVSSSQRRRKSFVFIDDDAERSNALEWLTIQTGFGLVMQQLDRYLSESLYLPVFFDADIEQHFNLANRLSTEPFLDDFDEVDILLCVICSITPYSNKENNVYYNTLEVVLYMRRMRPITSDLFNKLITVMGRISPELQRLIWARDAPALLILCHWLALMAALEQWWITPRAERECRALVMYLLAQKTEEQEAAQFRKVLWEPATRMGIMI